MASLKDIRRRIGSVKNTQQITKAMKMVSAAKLRRAQEMIQSARPFAAKIDELVGRLITDLQAETQGMDEAKAKEYIESLHPLLKNPNSQNPKTALIVISSDRGLCGAYNTNVYKRSLEKVTQMKEEGQDFDLFFIGKKAKDALSSRQGINGEHFSEFWDGTFSRTKSSKMCQDFVGKFTSGDYEKVEIIFTEFVSALTQTVRVKQLLPLSVSDQPDESTQETQEEQGSQSLPFIYKPSQKELLGGLLPTQVETQFFRCFADSLASEYGSRMTSMDNATRNAKEMIDALTLEANRVRQAAITTELTEIVSGAEALG